MPVHTLVDHVPQHRRSVGDQYRLTAYARPHGALYRVVTVGGAACADDSACIRLGLEQARYRAEFPAMDTHGRTLEFDHWSEERGVGLLDYLYLPAFERPRCASSGIASPGERRGWCPYALLDRSHGRETFPAPASHSLPCPLH